MDTDLLPELSSETWVAAVHLDEATGDLPPPDSDPDLIAPSITDKTTGRCIFGLVGLCRAVSGTPLMASPVWQFIHRFGQSTLASPHTPSDCASTRGATRRAPDVHPTLS